jgi:hypothetical protein
VLRLTRAPRREAAGPSIGVIIPSIEITFGKRSRSSVHPVEEADRPSVALTRSLDALQRGRHAITMDAQR